MKGILKRMRKALTGEEIMFKALMTKLSGLISKQNPPAPEVNEPEVQFDEKVGVNKRSYETYDDYVRHQSEKLGRVGERIVKSDQEYEQLVADRYSACGDFSAKSVLCLGARLGGEVRAFKSLGALAVGIDVEPGSQNAHVLIGDVHNIQFPDNSFDATFTNAIDHFLHIDTFLEEVCRVLKPGGVFFLEMTASERAKPSSKTYEVIDMSSHEPILEAIGRYFEIKDIKKIVNITSYISWPGTFVECCKRRE